MVLCRKPVDGGREEVLLDLNELAEHSGFVHVAAEIYRCVCVCAGAPTGPALFASLSHCCWLIALLVTGWQP